MSASARTSFVFFSLKKKSRGKRAFPDFLTEDPSGEAGEDAEARAEQADDSACFFGNRGFLFFLLREEKSRSKKGK